MDKFKLAELGERLKTGGAQMGRMFSGKVKEMKEILQTPTPESKMIDEATLETMEEPNWGMNLRICAMINSEEFSGTEVVKAIKKKISGKSVVSQRLSLDLLEACTMNCEKVFSEVASEKVLDEMVRVIDNPQMDLENRQRAMQLIRAWGESEDLAYLPVFHQTYMSLRDRNTDPLAQEGTSPTLPSTLESYVHEPLSPPERYPVPDTGLHGANRGAFPFNYQSLAVEEKKEFLVVARNSLELLSSILNTETDPKPLKEELTMNMLDKCKESQPIIKTIIETTTDDEGMLFEALFLHEELQQVISKYEELEASQKSGILQLQNPETSTHKQPEAAQNPGDPSGSSNTTERSEESEDTQKREGKLPENSIASEGSSSYAQAETRTETKTADSPKEVAKSSGEKVGE